MQIIGKLVTSLNTNTESNNASNLSHDSVLLENLSVSGLAIRIIHITSLVSG